MPTENAVGRRLAGRYLLEAEIASGGMGTVWRGRDEVLGRRVAVKILHDRLAHDPGLLERFRLEAVAAARLSHPAVVRVFDTGIDDGTCYIVMELFEGTTAQQMLADEGPLPPAEAARIVRGALRGLAHAHREGIVHRDVKPSNILVDDSGLVKVTDFGIAKAAFAGGDLTTTGDLLGTAMYLSPEQVSGREVDARSDVYSAGLVLFELVTGRPPFEADTHMATATMRLTRDPVLPRALRPGISRSLESVVVKALARDPGDRFQTAEEMSEALERWSPPGDEKRRASVPDGRLEAFSFLRGWILVPLMLVALVALGFGSFIVVRELLQGGEAAVSGGERARPLDIVRAASFDPSPGDEEEHDGELPHAVDEDPVTYWTTEGYNSPELGGRKEGVGLVLDLGEPQTATRVRIRTNLTGWAFRLYAAADLGGDPLVSSEGQETFNAEAETVTVSFEPVETRYLMLWIIELAPTEDGYRAHVNQVDVFPPRG